MISLLTCCMGHAGAPGVLASPFAAMHGLGSPLTSPYGNSAVGGMGGMHFNTLFCSVLLSSSLLFPSSSTVLFSDTPSMHGRRFFRSYIVYPHF